MSEDAQLHVVRGAPDDVELAALVAGIMAAATAAPADQPATPRAAWADRRRQLRPAPAPAPGPDSWRWSLRG
ncbi:acyl-CoA carboxylase subunit epsilon [Cellulomonas palmilytica]|uniref:acyl-CoA carboxylase subunit epsilon n=1 Tax=Cellulomonas palmilytica TaxID=2608402 RepID=UPI001F225DB7|nr:acyl-CoA carboxylase subunit epsilon [Cellulomonas palmilytica]UJP41264.1 acyl-CoA carboxylase subunit epsilon [Cellulomonas palmilytica]